MKRWSILFLMVAGLITAIYFFVRLSLQADIRKESSKTADSSSGSRRNPDSTLDLRPLFIAKIQQLVRQGSRGLYSISIDSMEVDMLQSIVVLQRVQLTHDRKILAALDSFKQAPDDVFNASFDTLKINGINLDDVLTRKTIDFRDVQIAGPSIEVYHSKKSYNRKKTVDSLTLFDRMMKDMKSISIGRLIIRKGTFTNHDLSKNKKNTLNNVELRFHDIQIDSSTEGATNRFLFAKQAFLSAKNYSLKTPDGIYVCKIGSITVNAPQQEMTIHDLSLASTYDRHQFRKKLVHQKEQYDIRVPKITIQNIDWWSLMHKDGFIADSVNVSGAVIKIHLDRSLPRPISKTGNFPHQLIMKLPLRISVDQVNLRSVDLTYEEYNPVSDQTGSISLNRADIAISNITNIVAEIKRKKRTVVTGTARFKAVPVKARFTFDLVNYKTGKFSAGLTTGGFQGNIMNDVAQPLGLARIEKGSVIEFSTSMHGDERQATGKVLLLYNDFKISLYEKEKDERGLDKKGVIGFLANAFVIKDDNPTKDNPVRNPTATFQRDPQAGFFNLVWKTALTGILKTVGANPTLAEKKKQ